MAPTDIVSMLRREEGEVLFAYPDHLGFLTIGVGRLIDSRKGGGISLEESAYLLKNDVSKCEQGLDWKLPWWRNLNEPRRAVLIGMCFQMGINGLLEFRNTLDLIRSQQWEAASRAMLASKWASQTAERAKRMADQIRFGLWQ